MVDCPMTPQERVILEKLATNNYVLKFGQLYRRQMLTLFPEGAQLNGLVDRMVNKGFIEKRAVALDGGVVLKCHMITEYGRERLKG